MLGSPEDIRRGPDFGLFPTDEIWGYGADGHGSLATLGEVWFRQQRVFWVTGGRGGTAFAKRSERDELCAGMRFMHPGPEYAGYNDRCISFA